MNKSTVGFLMFLSAIAGFSAGIIVEEIPKIPQTPQHVHAWGKWDRENAVFFQFRHCQTCGWTESEQI